MTDDRQYIPTPAEIALRSWIVDVFSGNALLADAVVYYANQGHVAIDAPRAIIDVLSDMQIQDAERYVDSASLEHVREHRTGTVQISCHGSLSYVMARAIQRSINDHEIVRANTARGVEIQNFLTGIMNRPEQLSTTIEQRRIIDARFAYSETFTSEDQVGVIERVIGTSTVEGFEGSMIDLQWPET